MKKRIVTLLTTALLLSFAFSSTVSAAGFVQDTAGVKFQNDDGSFAANTWVQAGTASIIWMPPVSCRQVGFR